MTWDGCPPGMADERTQLIGYLDRYREAIVQKVQGLTEAQARWKPAPTSNTLLNLVVHLAGVERNWFQHVIAGQAVERDRDAEFADLPPEVTTASAVAAYRRAWERSNEILCDLAVDGACRGEGMDKLSVRWVVLHMLEETARHAGHADITRELIDGAVDES